jgi:hypothetical protein
MRLLLTIAVAALLGAGPAAADLDVPLHTIDSGGGTSSSGSLVLSGTIGQADAGQTLAGGTFELRGGFWAGVLIAEVTGDFDGDADVDIDDYVIVHDCLTGPEGGILPDCGPVDLGGDDDVDIHDLAAFQLAFGG